MGDWDSNYVYEPTPLYEDMFRCRPFSKHPTASHLETGDKIIMPPSSLDRLMIFGVNLPFLFRITNPRFNTLSHCGVLQFVAEEGFVYMPEWMMKNLKLQEEGYVFLRAATLSRGCYMKLRPHKTEFTEMSNPKAVLEKKLREFSCLSKGDTIMIKHGEKKGFLLDVLEVRPGDAVSLIDTDCKVEFDEPLDYKEQDNVNVKMKEVIVNNGEKEDVVKKVDDACGEEEKTFRAFTGKGRRLDGGECSSAYKMDGLKEAVVEAEKIQKEKGNNVGKKGKPLEEGNEKKVLKPFTGRSCVLGA